MTNRSLLAAALLAATVAVPVQAARAQSASAQPATPAPAPEIFFRSPADGATVASSFSVVFGLRNYGVAPAGMMLNGTGHFHVLINVESPPPGALIPADSLHRHFGGGQIETALTLAPGQYTLRLVLADHEHKVISRELISKPIRVTVRR